MANKRIDQLTALSDVDANDDTKLFAEGSSTTGELFKITVAQAKLLFGVQKEKYVASGSEGSTLTISAIAGKKILTVLRESGPIYEVDSSPDPAEFTWDDTDIVLGTPVGGAGERFLILYSNY